ncbi:MAG: transcription antitermination factor NusB [Planctomycetota bacterium]
MTRPRRPEPVRIDGVDARGRVLDHLMQQVRVFPDLKLEGPPLAGLSDRDAAFAMAMYDAVIRRWLLIKGLASQYLSRPWDESPPGVRAALLGGGAQLLFLGGVPARAAVHETVSWVKARGGHRSSGAVNAVLRRIAELVEPETEPAPPPPVFASDAPEDTGVEPVERERATWQDGLDEVPLSNGRALVLAEEILPVDPLTRLSVVTSHPVELLRSWARDMSMREVRAVALHGLIHPPVTLNTAHARAPLPEGLTSHTEPGHHVYQGAYADLVTTLKGRSDIWVQDPASTLAASAPGDLEPKLIIDSCAGMGTKTRQLAAGFPDAEIIATDIDHVRLGTLRRTFEGSEQVRVVEHRTLSEWAGKADLVMLDVPCSNTGVLARRVEARYRWDERRTEQLLSMQRQILADSIPLVGRGGAILYSTCSLDARENEEQAAWCCRWHGFEKSREHRRTPQGTPGDPPERYSDGSYSVLLRSSG